MASVLPGAVGDVSRFCRDQQISRQTYYKWRARYAEGGIDGLRDRSRRPGVSPSSTPVEVEELIVRLRKQLAGDGEFNGPETIRERLRAAGVSEVPSRATIARVLGRRGLVRPQPRKRPRSSYRRFVAARPNEMWQSDWTGWQLANGREVAIAATIDDHSRLLVGIGACSGDATAELVWSVMSAAIGRYGIPMTSLSDNGMIYSNAHRPGHGPVALEINLRALGCQPIASTPYHPQTCGKIERLWQTLKKRLHAHGPHRSLDALNADLTAFAEHYNTARPHRALNGRTPAAVFAATTHARPAARPLPAPTTVHRTHASTAGVVVAGRYLIPIGARFAERPVTAIKDGDHIAIFSGNRLIRELTADPTRRYQRLHPHH